MWREDQKQAIEDCYKAIMRGYKYVILEGPCGTGKSSVAVELLRKLSGGRILTSQVLLQRQYSKDYPEFKVLEGSARYSCHMEGPPKTLVSGPVSEKDFEKLDYPGTPNCGGVKWFHKPTASFSRCRECPYSEALNEVCMSSFSILNYHNFYYQNKVRDGILEGCNLVLDEAHNLNKITTDLYTREFPELHNYSLPKLTLKDCHRPPKNGTADIVNKDYVEQVFEEYGEKLVEQLTFLKNMKASKENCKEIESLEEKLSHVHFQKKYVHKNAFTYSVVENKYNFSLVCKPISVKGLANTCFYSRNKAIIFMSATIVDTEVFCREVGVDPSKVFHYRMKDVFPPKNHVIRFNSNPQSMSLKSRKTSMPILLRSIERILDKHSGEKGIIHAQTHGMCREIVSNIKTSRFTYYKNRDYALREHGRKKGSVLVSPSMKEGLDLKGSSSYFQILLVVPYPMFDLHTLNKIKINGKYYQWATTVDFIQSLGRSVRSSSDTCTSYLLDSRFLSLINSMENKFSQYLLDCLPFEGQRLEV